MPTELLLLTVAKALAELAGLFILGQGALYLLAGKNRESNLFYQILKVLTRPVYRLVRLATPKMVLDRHIPLVAFILIFWIWVFLTIAKIQVCVGYGDLCKPRDQAGAPRAERFASAGGAGGPRL